MLTHADDLSTEQIMNRLITPLNMHTDFSVNCADRTALQVQCMTCPQCSNLH